MYVDSEIDGQSTVSVCSWSHTPIWSLRVVQKLYNRYLPLVGISPTHNEKRNPYQLPSGIVTPQPHNDKSTRTPEARHNNNSKGNSVSVA